jgi:hypothetical protein
MNPLSCAKCEAEITNSAVRFQGRSFHLACSPMFELLVEVPLDFNSLKLTSVAEAGAPRVSELEALIPAMRESAQDTLDALHRRGFRITPAAG